MGSFCTAVNCMDGRTQLPVNEYLRKKYGLDYVDTITEAGPNGILSRGTDQTLIDSIHARIAISVEKHGSRNIAVVGHHDCAGNPGDKALQISDIKASVAVLTERYPEIGILGLWVDENWAVSEVS